jgi:hypothetical protein
MLLEKRERSVARSGRLVMKRSVGLTSTSSRTIQPHLFPMSFNLNIENGLCEKLGKHTAPEQHPRESSSVEVCFLPKSVCCVLKAFTEIVLENKGFPGLQPMYHRPESRKYE